MILVIQAIKNIQVVTEDRVIQQQAVLFDSVIREIVAENDVNPGTPTIDGGGLYLTPGFIDLHIHGCAGYDTMDEDPQALTEIARHLVQTGVTAFLPTTMTMEFGIIAQALERVRGQMQQSAGAQILGCHLEGPFLNRKYKGAQNEKYIIGPDFSLIRPYADVIRIITLAPEWAGAIEFIKECRRHHILISLGHSDASLAEAATAIAVGAGEITHTFNAMSPLHHRNPGLVAAALLYDVTCEIIADNIHVDPGIQQLLYKIKGLDRIVLITDAMRACLLQDGEYDLGGQLVEVSKNSARLKDGTLAGSVLTLNHAIKNFRANSNLEIWQAVRLASLNPSRELGLRNKGSIALGKDADFVLMDQDFNVVMTFIAGELVYRRS